MNNSTSAVSSKKSESEIFPNHSNKQDDFITITEKITLRKKQYEVLKVICDTYRFSLSQYMQEVLIEAMKSDIDEGNFCDVLLKKIRNKNDDGAGNRENNKNNNTTTGPSELINGI
jgi:hypothetical protein